ncbi:MAG: glycosyltransferase [Pseudomonadota bacterium]
MTQRRAAFAIPGDLTTPTGGYMYERRLLEELQAQGRDTKYLKLGDTFPDASPAHMADAIAQLKALEVDRAVILDGFVSATLETDALASLQIPTIAMVHHPLAFETGLDEARREQLHALERANLRRVSHVLVPSPATKTILIDAYSVPAEKITIARPGTDRRARAGEKQSPPLILSVGIQHPRKGHDVLLEALAKIQHLDWQAVIAGKVYDEAFANTLVNLHRDLGLERRVKLAGYVGDDELTALYSSATIFALATRFEGYGLVFDEALANGLPIVSCHTGAVPDTIPKNARLLVQVDDPAALADALTQLLQNPELYRSKQTAAQNAGDKLPTWADTAKIAGSVLDDL